MTKKKILYVDDDPDKRERVADVLRKNGFQVSTPPGLKTIDLQNETEIILKRTFSVFDLLLLDVMYDNDRLGGLKLYIDLEKNYARRWNNLLIFSRLAKTGSERENTIINDFLIHRDFDLNNWVSSEDKVLDKVINLLGDY